MRKVKKVTKRYTRDNFTVIMTYDKNKKLIKPVVGEVYDIFDDGKIRRSRHYQVQIVSITTPRKLRKYDPETVDAILADAKSSFWLYRPKVKTIAIGITEDGESRYFIPTKQNGWFSTGFWAGELDDDGSLREIMEKQEENK